MAISLTDKGLIAILMVASVCAGIYSDCLGSCQQAHDSCNDDCQEAYCESGCGGSYFSCLSTCNDLQDACEANCSIIDEDGDGISDDSDSLVGDQDDIVVEGLSGIEVQVGLFMSNQTEASEVVGEQDVVVTAQGGLVLEFTHDFAEPLELTKVQVKKQVETKRQGIVVSGLDMEKTIYIDKLKEEGSLCIKDSEISDLSEISRGCTGVNEFYFGNCDSGETIGRYTCTVENGKYKVAGLRHSGAAELNLSGVFNGYFTATYHNEATNHRDGYLMPGEGISICFESARPIQPDEKMKIVFVPRIGGLSVNEFYMPQVINLYNMHLYP